MARGRKLSDAYVEIRADDSKLRPEVKVKATRVGREFGGALNKQLKALKLDPIDMKVSPAEAIASIETVRQRLQSLSADADTVELRVKADDAIRQVDRFRKKLGESGGEAGPEAAAGFAARFGARVGPLLASVPLSSPLAIAAGVAGAAMAPVLGGAVAGGVIGGVGLGGVIGGLSLAAKDQRVAKAADEMGTRIENRLLAAAGVFVQPALQAMTQIEAATRRIDIETIFRQAQRFVPVLTRGVTSALDDLGEGFEASVANARPVIESISRAFATIGATVGGSLKLLSQDAEAGASSLDDLVGSMNYFVQVTVGVLHGLAAIKSALDDFDSGIDNFRYKLEDALSIGDRAGTQFDITADGMSNMERRAKQAAEGVEASNRAFSGQAESIRKVVDEAEVLKERQAALTLAQQGLTAAQQAYNASLDAMNPRAAYSTQLIEGLRRAQQAQSGGAIAASEANEAYEAGLDSLSDSVKANKGSLDASTAAGRSNRDSLQSLLTASNEMYYANIQQGMSTDEARRKHENRTKAIEREADKLGLNDRKTKDLIKTYGQIPGRKETDLIADGVNQIIIELKRVYWAQRALAEGKTVEQVRRQGTMGAFSALAEGGEVPGWSPHSKADNVPALLTAKEWVHPVAAVDYYGPKAMEAIQHRRIPREAIAGYAYGGRVIAPIETRRDMRFPVNVRNAYVMSREEALKKVAPVFGEWPSSPAAQRGDSGIWRRVLQVIRAGPDQGSFGNAYRPGDPKWHGSGRAVDWMGFNMDALASYLAAKRPLELIHRTNRRDYAYTRGVNKGSFNNALMEAHRNHIHIAFAGGGQVQPVRQFAMDDGWFRNLQPGLNAVYNGTGRTEPIAGPAGMAALSGSGEVHVHIHDSVIASRQAAEDLVVEAVNSARRKRRIP